MGQGAYYSVQGSGGSPGKKKKKALHPTVTHPMLPLIPEHGEHLLAVVIIGNAILKWVGGGGKHIYL